jgi:protein-disulfide isomerase
MPKILSTAFVLLFVATALPVAAADKTPVVTPQDHILGEAAAPVTIIEYASLTCPHCAAFEKDTLPSVKKNWIDSGKAKLVFRDFPLDRYALTGSLIAQCAPPDRYFAFIESFFDGQDSWVRAGDPVIALKGIARIGGMNEAAVDKCLADEKQQKTIIGTEMQAKNDYGVDSTPTFFIIGANGANKVVGEESYDDFSKALTAALPKS